MKALLHLALLFTLSPSFLYADPTAPAQGKKVQLELTPDSTREQVIAALKAKGLPTTEAQVDAIMAKLAVAKNGGNTPAPTPNELAPASPPSAPAPDPTEATDSAASVALRKYLRSKYMGMDLDYDAFGNFYYAKGKVNGVDARFTIDSGAFYSKINEKSAEKFGLVLKEAGSSRGIGGLEKNYVAEIKSMSIGPHLRMPPQEISVSAIGDASMKDGGLVGADILTKIGGIIDFRTHRLMYPKPGSPTDLANLARTCGMQEIALVRSGNWSILEAKVGDKPLRFLVDTGAQQTVLDNEVARQLGLKAIPSRVVATGVGAGQAKLEMTTLGDIAIGAVHLSRMPVLLTSLANAQAKSTGKVDGILGADFLYASDAVFDVGAGRLYVEPGVVDVRNFTKTGAEMFASDAELKQAWNAAPRVIVGQVRKCEVLPGIKTDAAGQPCEIVEITVSVNETLKGASASAATEVIRVTIPPHENQKSNITGILGRNHVKLIFLPSSTNGTPPALTSTIWSDGDLPRAQLKRIQ